MQLMCALVLLTSSPMHIPYGMPRVSYNEARAKVFANPLPDPLPPVPALPEVLIATNFGGVLKRFSHIVKDPADFRTGPTKVVHKYGVCADAVWEMDAPSNATGLFRQGTRVPAIVRFATGTNRTVHLPLAARTWGVAIKLFPTTNPDEAVVTRNLVLFDQYGLDGQARPHFLQPTDDDPPLYFTNHIKADALTSQAPLWLLNRFDRHPLFRSLMPLADIDVVDNALFSPRVPELIHLHPRIHAKQRGTLPADYRDELRAYPPGELVFDVVLPSQPISPQVTRIGTLTVGEMVLSEVCDGSLQFWHPPVPYGERVPP